MIPSRPLTPRLRTRFGAVVIATVAITAGGSVPMLAAAQPAAAQPAAAQPAAAQPAAAQPFAAQPAAIAPAGSRPIGRDGLAGIADVALQSLQEFTRTWDTAARDEYVKVRNGIATEVSMRLGIDPARMIAAWDVADVPHQTALMAAFTQLGVPYRRMSSQPGTGFDCSGLTTFAWGVAGTTLVRQSGSQIANASPRTQETAMAGDLMQYPGHVMLYLGVDRAMVHSPYTGRSVEVDHMSGRRTPRFGNPIG